MTVVEEPESAVVPSAAPRRAEGRVPPHNLEAEESLLGALLLSRDAIHAVAADVRLTQADFYRPAHGHIYAAIMKLYTANEPVDPVAVSDELLRIDLLDMVGGSAALVGIQARTPATSSAAYYARVVVEHALLRRLIGTAGEIAEIGYSMPDDVAAAVDQAEARIFELGHGRISDTTRTVQQLGERVLDRLDAILEGTIEPGIPTGFHDLDRRVLGGGLERGRLYVVGARPGVGKTSWALAVAEHVARQLPVLFFSLEMSGEEVMERLLAMDAHIATDKLHAGELLESQWAKLSQSFGRLGERPIVVDDLSGVSVNEIRGKARRMKASRGLGLVVIDYLNLMTGPHAENRQVEVAEMSRGCKVLARELDVPVILCSQLNRANEIRANKRPMLSDLRESGAIEQNADAVLFLHRESMYSDEPEHQGKAEVLVEKNRHGPTGMVPLAFLDYCTKFANMGRI